MIIIQNVLFYNLYHAQAAHFSDLFVSVDRRWHCQNTNLTEKDFPIQKTIFIIKNNLSK